MKTDRIIAIVGLIAAVGFGIMPLQKMAAEEEVLNRKLFLKKKQQIEQVERLEKIAKAGSFEIYIPDEGEELAMVDNLREIGRKTGITIPSDWNFNANYNSDIGAEMLAVNFPIQGKNQQIVSFLKGVENNPRFLGVKDFSISRDFNSALSLSSMNVSVYGFSLRKK